jgi:hypothetical protein
VPNEFFIKKAEIELNKILIQIKNNNQVWQKIKYSNNKGFLLAII